MKSSFDLTQQNKNIESKIVVALERISEAFRVLLWQKSKENSLSPIQIQTLIFLLYHSDEMCKVSYLAQEFNMTKATISDSVRVLLDKGLIEKKEDPNDTRSFGIGLTKTGRKAANDATNFTSAIEKPLNQLSLEQKEIMMNSLFYMIHELHQAGIITIQRMCFTCSHYRYEKEGHFCTLLQTKLANTQLRIDCPEHELTV